MFAAVRDTVSCPAAPVVKVKLTAAGVVPSARAINEVIVAPVQSYATAFSVTVNAKESVSPATMTIG